MSIGMKAATQTQELTRQPDQDLHEKVGPVQSGL